MAPVSNSRTSAPHACAAQLALALLAGLGGCDQRAREERWLELRQIRPENKIDVYLNERIVLHFSEPLDPSSVHPAACAW
jgi:hypothetical protein